MRSGRHLLVGSLVVAAAIGCGRSGSMLPEGSSVPLPHFPGDDDDDAATPDVGDGHDGALVVDGVVTVNECIGVIAAAGSSVTLANAPTAAFVDGRRIVVVQTQVSGAVSGFQAPLATGDAGRWEIARLSGTAGNTLLVESALAFVYDSGNGRRAQVCSMPEHTAVQCGGAAGSRLVAPPWNGTAGGILALYASEGLAFVVNDCQLSAQSRGFRGGVVGAANGSTNIILEDTTLGAGGGKGEGLDSVSFTREGRGNYFNGGGGGNANESGGGGGANIGAGGLGGTQDQNNAVNPSVNGRGGAPVAFTDLRLVFGGGGGAGQRDVAAENAGAGGIGGGVVLVITSKVASAVTGSVMNVSGTPGGDSQVAGAGGGGAGGTLVLVVTDDAASAAIQIDVSGGRGGNHESTDARRGPGGGGGGGLAWIDAPPGPMLVGTDGSISGVNSGIANDPYQALPGEPGARRGP